MGADYRNGVDVDFTYLLAQGGESMRSSRVGRLPLRAVQPYSAFQLGGSTGRNRIVIVRSIVPSGLRGNGSVRRMARSTAASYSGSSLGLRKRMLVTSPVGSNSTCTSA